MLKNILQNKVFKNFSYLTMGSVLSQLISLFTILKITKILHPDDYGIYSFIIAQGTLILTIGDLGIRNIVIRTIARDASKTNDLMYNGAILRSIALIFISLFYLGYNHLLGNLDTSELILVFTFAFISCFGKLFETAYLGHQKMLPPSLINLFFSILWFILVFLIPEPYFQVTLLLWVFLALNLIKNLVFFISLKRQHLLIGKVERFWVSSSNLLKESWPYFALVIVMLPFTKFSSNFLDINSTIEQVGFYNLSERFTGPVSFVLDFALVAIFPNLSALWVTDKLKFVDFIRHGFKYFMMLGMVMCFLFTLFAGEIFGFLFPSNYAPAILVCQMQIWYLYLTSIDSLIGTILGATNHEKKILQLGIVNSLFSTPILYYGSTFGAIGLSIGAVVSFTIFQFYLWFIFKKTLKINIEDKKKMWVAAGILFIISYFLSNELSFLIKLGMAGAVLAFCGFYFKNRNKFVLK